MTTAVHNRNRLKDFVEEEIFLRSKGGVETKRNHPLLISNPHWDLTQPLLTVELATKWYELFLLTGEGDIWHFASPGWKGLKLHSIHFGHLETAVKHINISPYVDHVPNPTAVRLFARQNGYEIDELAWDLINGRWQYEVSEQDWTECERCEGAGIVYVMADTIHCHSDTCRACKGFGGTTPRRA